jgi:hypothetical protein
MGTNYYLTDRRWTREVEDEDDPEVHVGKASATGPGRYAFSWAMRPERYAAAMVTSELAAGSLVSSEAAHGLIRLLCGADPTGEPAALEVLSRAVSAMGFPVVDEYGKLYSAAMFGEVLDRAAEVDRAAVGEWFS